MRFDGAVPFAGDYNDNNQVEQGDLDLVLQNWGVDTDVQGVPVGWVNDLPSGSIDQVELDAVLRFWGDGIPLAKSAGVVPEPVTVGVLALSALAVSRLRRRG